MRVCQLGAPIIYNLAAPTQERYLRAFAWGTPYRPEAVLCPVQAFKLGHRPVAVWRGWSETVNRQRSVERDQPADVPIARHGRSRNGEKRVLTKMQQRRERLNLLVYYVDL